jgi:5'-nucleotidase
MLHSNDMHGDFLSDEAESKLVGGISLLSGYVSQVRKETKNTIYCIAGDMLQGSRIDSEFQGISTIEIMNMLAPDVACIGNHEVDYGLAHLLFLERCARFPIINANLFIKHPMTRLFTPQKIIRIAGMKIMFIGITTEEILASIKKENLLGSFVDIYEAADEVGHICNAFRTTDIDLTVLLTHIGFEEDKKLAAILDPEWGVDVIIGGHSHTVLEEPAKVNDIYIVQAGTGTNQIGRFDFVVDTDMNTVHDFKWQLVPVDSEHCPRDKRLEEIIAGYANQTDEKYSRLICRLPEKLTHPSRYQETALGNFFADILQEALQVDIMFLGSGSIRKEIADPIVTYGDLIEIVPYDEKLYQLKATGAQLRQMLLYMLREEALMGEHTEFYQFSIGLEVVYDRASKFFLKFNYFGIPIDDSHIYSFALTDYHYVNFSKGFGFPLKDLMENGKPLLLSTSLHDVLIEHLIANLPKAAKVEGRLVIQNNC